MPNQTCQSWEGLYFGSGPLLTMTNWSRHHVNVPMLRVGVVVVGVEVVVVAQTCQTLSLLPRKALQPPRPPQPPSVNSRSMCPRV